MNTWTEQKTKRKHWIIDYAWKDNTGKPGTYHIKGTQKAKKINANQYVLTLYLKKRKNT